MVRLISPKTSLSFASAKSPAQSRRCGGTGRRVASRGEPSGSSLVDLRAEHLSERSQLLEDLVGRLLELLELLSLVFQRVVNIVPLALESRRILPRLLLRLLCLQFRPACSVRKLRDALHWRGHDGEPG